MNEEQAWARFQNTGSVQAYLEYARLTQAAGIPPRPPQPQEETHAGKYRGPDPHGEVRG